MIVFSIEQPWHYDNKGKLLNKPGYKIGIK